MKSKIFHKNNKGFTLIELIVAISIFAILSSIMVFNYGSFKSSLSIQNLADDIALSVRKAQGYAIGVHSFNNSFTSGYGVHFSTNSDASDLSAGSNKSFILFADINYGKEYNHDSPGCGNPTTQNECLEVLNITSADEIKEILSGSTSVDTLDIIFKRPNPEPKFCVNGDCSDSTSFVKIKISNGNTPEVFKIITISNVGQISVSNN